MSSRKSLNTSDYQVGWIAALPVERAAAEALLDEEHDPPGDFTQHHTDDNVYSWGSVSGHNIVIASLSSGIYGTVSAATTAQGLLSSLSSVKVGLLVGVGAGIPENGLDIRLGDVAVSRPQGTSSGVLQYDFGKAKADGHWEYTGFLNPPPLVLLKAMGKLQTEHELQEPQVPAILEEAGKKNPRFAANFSRPGMNDRLFYWNSHAMAEEERQRPERNNILPKIHYGIIASGNKLVKDAQSRAAIFAAMEHSCICLEMEAAGLMNNFPCLVVRGICDYADAHKNDDWHRYASATAAAYAKELLRYVPQFELDQTRKIGSLLGDIQSSINDLKADWDQNVQADEQSKFMQALDTCPYRERKDRNPTRAEGTCKWAVNHQRFEDWQNDRGPGLLWLSADPGCGKSVLARHLIDDILPASGKTICYFFFKDDFTNQNNSADAICALLRQLLESHPEIITTEMIGKFNNNRNSYVTSIQTLWETFIDASHRGPMSEVICVLDALDECQEKDRRGLIKSICEYAQNFSKASKIKFLITSRPYIDIKDGFYDLEGSWPTIHLSGEDGEEVKAISQEISVATRHRIRQFSQRRQLTQDEEQFLLKQFTSQAQRTYLWADLTLDIIERTPDFSKGTMSKVIEHLPNTLDEVYNSILNRSLNQDKARLLLQLIVAAQRPFSVNELSRLIALSGDQKDFSELDDYIEPEERFKITIRNLCGFLIVIVDGMVYLLHQTVREFLIGKKTDEMPGGGMANRQHVDTSSSWKASSQLHTSHRTLAERCLWLLTLRTRSIHSSDASLLSLLDYSDYFWPSHFRCSDIAAEDRLFSTAIAHSHTMRPHYHNIWGIMNWGLGHPFRLSGNKPSEQQLCALEAYQLDGDRYLNCLSFLGLSKIVKWLLDNARFAAGRKQVLTRALYWATLGGYTETAHLLLKSGAPPNLKAQDQAKPFKRIMCTPPIRMLSDSSKFYESDRVTGMMGPTETLPVLMTVTPLHSAVHMQDRPLVASLLSYGAQTNAASAFADQTPLHFAARLVNKPIIQLLLEYGADKKLQDRFSCGPIEFFFARGFHGKKCDMILRLLWYDGWNDFNDGQRLWLLSNTDCNTCVSFTLKNSIHVSENDRQSALSRAVQRGHDNVGRLFVEAGGNVNTPGKHGVTLLMHAASRTNNSSSIVKYLLEQGANIQACDFSGANCVHYVRNEEALKVLLAQGADINAKDHSGVTPLLQVFLDQGRSMLYNAMLKCGALPDIKDNYGLSVQSLTIESSEQLRGNFSRTSYEVGLDAEMNLTAMCNNIQSIAVPASINLNRCLENVWGKFRWGGRANFLATARNVRLLGGGKILVAELGDGRGGRKPARVRLDERIQNNNGVLRFIR